jgi:hypothetical protein
MNITAKITLENTSLSVEAVEVITKLILIQCDSMGTLPFTPDMARYKEIIASALHKASEMSGSSIIESIIEITITHAPTKGVWVEINGFIKLLVEC